MLARLGLLGTRRPRAATAGAGHDSEETRAKIAGTTFDAELLEGVAAFVESEKFLSHLEATTAAATQNGDAAAASSSSPAAAKQQQQQQQPHLKLVERAGPGPTASSAAAAAAAVADSSPSSSGVLVAPAAEGGYVVVTRQDAVEAMAYFIADCLSRSPEAQGMDPKQLQRALSEAMGSLRRAKWRAVLGWGRVAAAALSYGASLVLAGGQPPALYRALVAALWAAARMAYRAVG